MKTIGRLRRHKRFMKTTKGSSDRPRLVVFRSSKHIYAQLVNDTEDKVLTGCSTLSKELACDKDKPKLKGLEAAKEVGLLIAKKAKDIGIETIAFDRGGYKYHGRVKALADSARKGGLKF